MNYFSLFEDTFRMDQRLHQLALYDVTKGKIVIPNDIDEAICLQKLIVKKFNYFKTLIQNNDCTFSYIEQTVLKNNGPYPKKEMEDLNELLNAPKEKYGDINSSSDLAKNFLSLLLGSKEQNECIICDKDEKENEKDERSEKHNKRDEKPKRKYVRKKKSDNDKK